MAGTDLRARGDSELFEKLIADADVAKAIESVEKMAAKMSARRELLATAVRLTPTMAPTLARTMDECRRSLSVETPIETYVYPSPIYNAAAVRPERGRLFVLFSSSLLEDFTDAELKFVVGHELGHHLFGHHRIPISALVASETRITASLALQLFAWQRYAEISCDRSGLLCAGALGPCASSLFKLASGLHGGSIQIRVEDVLSQIGDLQAEADRLAASDEPVRSDWFATHPFSPLRLRAVQLAAASVLLPPGTLARDALELAVTDLMGVMEPSYLSEKTDVAETMRRLLFAAGVKIASLGETLDPKALAELERLLGPGSVPTNLSVETVLADLPRRMEEVKASVPALRRLQVLRDLCTVAKSDGFVTDEETAVLYQVAAGIGVDGSLVTCSTEPPPGAAAHFLSLAPEV